MLVQDTLNQALACLSQAKEQNPSGIDAVDEARNWLARTEALLDWIARHPKMHEIDYEAAVILLRYRGSHGS